MEVGHQILSAGESNALAGSILNSGVSKHLLTAEAPMDENHQTSDLEELVAGIDGGNNLTLSLDVLRRVPEILREGKDGTTLTTFLGQIVDIEAGDTRDQMYGMAFDIAELMLAGGFGNYVSTESAVRIRLLPSLPLDKITYVRNAAHLGAELALLSETERRRACDIAGRIEHVALATRPEFQELFVDACGF